MKISFLRIKSRSAFALLTVLVIVFLSVGIMSCAGKTKRAGAVRDCHIHLISTDASARLQDYVEKENITGLDVSSTGGDEVVGMLDEASVDKATVFSGAYFMGSELFLSLGGDEYENTKAENDWSAREVAEYPGRLTLFCSFNPLKDYAVAELDRCIDSLNAAGLKLHLANSGVDLKNEEHLERLEEVFAQLEKKDVPVLMHFAPADPMRLAYGKEELDNFINQVLVKHPGVRVCYAHLMGGGSLSEEQLNAFRTMLNAYDSNPSLVKENGFVDISAVVTPHALTFGDLTLEPPTDKQLSEATDLMRRWGLERVLYGCDFPALPPKEALELDASRMPLTVDEYNLIMNNDNSSFLYGGSQ